MLALLEAWIIGSGVVAVLFLVLLWHLWSLGTEDSRLVFHWFRSLCVEYIVFWPWRCVLFPLWKRHEICKRWP